MQLISLQSGRGGKVLTWRLVKSLLRHIVISIATPRIVVIDRNESDLRSASYCYSSLWSSQAQPVAAEIGSWYYGVLRANNLAMSSI